MDLTTVSTGVSKRILKKRVGRGIGSGHGKTGTRGHKGQYASAGAEMAGVLFAGDLVENGAVPWFGDGYPLDWPETAYRVAELAVGVIVGVGVELSPQRHPFAGVGIDEHDGRIVGKRGADVGPLRQVRRSRVDAGHVCQQRGVRAEPVVAVPLGEVDGDTG